MRIAVATMDGETISGHLGRCSKFLVFSVEDGSIMSKEVREIVPIHGSQHGHHGHHAHHHGGHATIKNSFSDCAALITGGMGMPMAVALQSAGIDPVITDETNPDTAVLAYLQGTLSKKDFEGCGCGGGHN